jgi:hypothetical protein
MLDGFMKEHRLKKGRVALFHLLDDQNLQTNQRKCYQVTTNVNHWMKMFLK